MGRALNREEFEALVSLAIELGFEDSAQRGLLLAWFPKKFKASLAINAQPSVQLRHDLITLNQLEALEEVEGRPLALWLREAVTLARGSSRVEVTRLEALLALVRDPPAPPAPVVTRLRTLLVEVLTREPLLCSRLAAALGQPNRAEALADHCLGLAIDQLIDPLLALAGVAALADGVRQLARVVLPAATDWRALRGAQPKQVAGAPAHLEVPFLLGPLCEVVVAAAQDRPAQLDHRDHREAAVPVPSLAMVPVLPDGKRLDLLVAEAILLGPGRRRRDQLHPDPERLLKDARDAIEYRRNRAPHDRRYQMYLVFETAEDGALRALAGNLPDLWLVQGRREDDQTLFDALHDLFDWKS